jgi:hypothetical protein
MRRIPTSSSPLSATRSAAMAVDKYSRVYVNFSPAVGRDAGLMLLQKVGGGGLFVESARLIFLNPQAADEIPTDVVAFRQPVQRRTGQKFPGDLTRELDAVGAMLGMGFRPSKARQTTQSLSYPMSGPRGLPHVRPEGPTP